MSDTGRAHEFMNHFRAKTMTEAQLQAAVIELAGYCGFPLIYHTYRSDGSAPGFPDLVMVSPRQRRVVFAELKREKGRVTQAQQKWIDGLAGAGQEAAIWRPNDLVTGAIAASLKGRPQ